MSKKVLFIIASSGFQEHEYGEPRRLLEEAGFKIDVASDMKGECIGSFLNKINSDYSLEEVDINNYDLVVMVGGPGAWINFHKNNLYLEIAKKAKILGAICIAPAIVSDSGIYDGIKVTGWDQNGEQKEYIENNGGIFTGESVTVSGKFITANGPQAATQFGEELVKKIYSI